MPLIRMEERPLPHLETNVSRNVRAAVHAAYIAARIARADYFCNLVSEHEGHRTFRAQSWPRERCWGFTCGCGEEELEVKIPITDIRHLDAQDMYVLYNSFNQMFERYRIRERRDKGPAIKRAKILLHKHLTRNQILELKHCKEFTVIGKDGNEYLITEGACNNVRLVENGVVTKSFCIVFKDHEPLPMYDLMLIQKLLLETNPEEFWKISNITNIQPLKQSVVRSMGSARLGPITEERANDLTENLRIIYERTQQAQQRRAAS